MTIQVRTKKQPTRTREGGKKRPAIWMCIYMWGNLDPPYTFMYLTFVFCANMHTKTRKPEINLEHSCTLQVIHNKGKNNNNNIKSQQAINICEEERDSNITLYRRSCFGWMTSTNLREFTDERDDRVSEGSKVRVFWREMKLGFIIRANTYLGICVVHFKSCGPNWLGLIQYMRILFLYLGLKKIVFWLKKIIIRDSNIRLMSYILNKRYTVDDH